MSDSKYVRIVATPSGFATEEIRAQWVGLILPLATGTELWSPPDGLRIGAANGDGYLIVRTKAVEALRAAGRHEAAEVYARCLHFYLVCEKCACVEVDGP